MSSVHALPPAERALYSKIHHILEQPGLVAGSLVIMNRRCGKEGCRCKKSPRNRHRALCVSVRMGSRRRLLYVPEEWEDRITEWVSRYHDVRGLLMEISNSFVRRLVKRDS
jgi:hypothetical protein